MADRPSEQPDRRPTGAYRWIPVILALLTLGLLVVLVIVGLAVLGVI